MIVEKKHKLEFFQDLYENAKNKRDDITAEMELALAQYNGSKKLDGTHEEASTVRNITYELIESEITTYIPRAIVGAEIYSERNERCAKSIEELCNRLRNRLPLEVLNDIDERMTYIFGSSVWLVEWDESQCTHNTVGDISLRVISPEDFFPQPDIDHIDDMEYCFIKYEATVDDVSRAYGVSVSLAQQGENDEYSDNDEVITVVICYYKGEDGTVNKYVWSGDVELLNLENMYARRKKVCKHCHKDESICLCEGNTDKDYDTLDDEYEELEADIVNSNGDIIPAMTPKFKHGEVVTKKVTVTVADDFGTPILGDNGLPMTEEVDEPVLIPTKIPFYKPKRLPVVIRRNTARIGSIWGESDCLRIRPQQQAINKVESRILQKLLRAGVTPYMPEDATITMNNSVFGEIVKIPKGDSARDYGTLDTTPNIAQDIAEAERLYDHAKRILGISDAYQGQADTTAKSGYAKQLQINQSGGRLQSKRALKHSLYADLDRAIFELYLAFADEPRPLPYRDELGRVHDLTFNRYDFVRTDDTGNYYYSDQFLFSADAAQDVEGDRASLWELNLNNLRGGTYGDPASPETMVRYWSAQEKAHYPNARDNVEYFKDIYKRLQEQMQGQLPEGGINNV